MIMQTNMQTIGLRKTRPSSLVNLRSKIVVGTKTYNAEFKAIREYKNKSKEKNDDTVQDSELERDSKIL